MWVRQYTILYICGMRYRRVVSVLRGLSGVIVQPHNSPSCLIYQPLPLSPSSTDTPKPVSLIPHTVYIQTFSVYWQTYVLLDDQVYILLSPRVYKCSGMYPSAKAFTQTACSFTLRKSVMSESSSAVDIRTVKPAEYSIYTLLFNLPHGLSILPVIS